MKICVICPNWVGDLVMATPALRAIRLEFPTAEVVGVMRTNLKGLLDGTGLIDRTILIPHGKSNSWSLSLDTLKKLRHENFDRCLLMPNSLRSAIWGYLGGARERFGFRRNGRNLLLTHPIPAPDRSIPHPVMDDYLRLAAELGCKNCPRTTELSVSSEDASRLETFWKKHPDIPSDDVVCLNSGGAFGASKHWPPEHFSLLGKRIAERLGKGVLVLCGPQEREIAREIVRSSNHPQVVGLENEELSLGLTKAAISRSRLLVTTDSGPRHFAAPFGVPAVVLYGPTNQLWSRIDTDLELPLQLQLDCGPCQKRICPLGHHRCMKDLNPERVFEAVVDILRKPKTMEKRAA